MNATANPCAVTLTNAPALAHDAMMLERFGCRVGANGRLERFIVWNLCAHMAAKGWNVHDVYDSEEITKVADARAAMELIFNLDEAWITFAKGRNRHRVFLVIGNGCDIVSDWGYTVHDPDGFNAAMESFDSERVADALGTVNA